MPPPIAQKSVEVSTVGRVVDAGDHEVPESISNSALAIDSCFGTDEWWPGMSIEPETSNWDPLCASIDDMFLPTNPSLSTFDNFGHLSPMLPDAGSSWLLGVGSSISRSLPDDHFPLPNSLILNSREHHALGHFQTTFSIYRTTKDPEWSTHKLLLSIGAEDEMIMHLILAVSINDVCHRQGHESSQEAQRHFEAGTQALIKTIEKDSPADHVYLMAGFLFLYLYMPKRKSIPRQRIRQLSMTVRDFVKKHNLDNLCLEPLPENGSPVASQYLNTRDRSILARLIIWIFDEDVKCGFQDSGGYLAEHLTAHRERTMAVYEVSRTVLEVYWGSNYPQCQTDDDNDNAVELEFLWVLTALWQDINELAEGSTLDPGMVQRRIKQRFSLLEKVSLHLQYSLHKLTYSRNISLFFKVLPKLQDLALES